MNSSPGSAAAQAQDKTETTIRLRMRLPVIWLAVLVVGALLLPDRVWTTLLVGFGGLFLVAYFWVWMLARGLRASRRLRFGWVAVGDRLGEEFLIANRSEVPALWLEILDQSNVPGYQAAVVRSVGPAEEASWRASAVCSRRGLFHLGPWQLRSSDPFGIFSVTWHFPEQQEIIIHPPIHGGLALPLPRGQSSGRARTPQRAWHAAAFAATVREYHAGDPYKWIHWRSSARHGRLNVQQFDHDAAGDIWILLDLEKKQQLRSGEADGTEEHAILLAASLAARALNHNRNVGLMAHGSQSWIVPPGAGQGQQWKILRALALAEAGGDLSLAGSLRDLNRVAHQGAAVVIFTPTAAVDWQPELTTLARGGVISSVMLLDRPSFGGEGRSEPIRDMIRRLGFEADIIRRGDVGLPQEPQDKHGYWEFKVSGLGKVVTVSRPDEQSTPP